MAPSDDTQLIHSPPDQLEGFVCIDAYSEFEGRACRMRFAAFPLLIGGFGGGGVGAGGGGCCGDCCDIGCCGDCCAELLWWMRASGIGFRRRRWWRGAITGCV
ncbi:MAG: hypothetical protein R3C05_01285 [Pirellulaceae bacterium]